MSLHPYSSTTSSLRKGFTIRLLVNEVHPRIIMVGILMGPASGFAIPGVASAGSDVRTRSVPGISTEVPGSGWGRRLGGRTWRCLVARHRLGADVALGLATRLHRRKAAGGRSHVG